MKTNFFYELRDNQQPSIVNIDRLKSVASYYIYAFYALFRMRSNNSAAEYGAKDGQEMRNLGNQRFTAKIRASKRVAGNRA